MTLISMRELLEFPSNPDNATDTTVNGIHFNLTALTHFNYTLYSNGTLSNGTNCWLSFGAYRPQMLWNGTFINATSCYAPIESVELRGSIGIAFATLFALTIVFSLINLRKHGRRFLPATKKWSIVGRRWQWYWMIFLGACGTISCFMSIDVDRSYLQSTPIVLQSIFYHMMLPILLAAVWEGVRHWGSWLEREIYDRDAFAFVAGSTRERQELYLPIVFYVFAFMHFFLTVPRSWTPIEKQRSPEQQYDTARPSATDGRFKAAGIVAIPCIIITCYGLGHSLYRYKRCPDGRSPLLFYAGAIPVKFILVIPLACIRLCFNIAAAFDFAISPLKYDGGSGWLYGLGYAPVLLILIILNIWGYIDKNEDRLLIEQRIARGQETDAELGVIRKPGWWKMTRSDYQNTAGLDATSRLQAMVSTTATARKPINPTEELEMPARHSGRDINKGGKQAHTTQAPVANRAPPEQRHDNESLNPRGGPDRVVSGSRNQFTASSGETRTSQVPQQKVRSMLDV